VKVALNIALLCSEFEPAPCTMAQFFYVQNQSDAVRRFNDALSNSTASDSTTA